MSMTAKERARKMVKRWVSDHLGLALTTEQFTYLEKAALPALEDEMIAALRAHANAALERAWSAGASVETTGKYPQRVQDEMLAAIRALRKEE